jgi:hypothetical protein
MRPHPLLFSPELQACCSVLFLSGAGMATPQDSKWELSRGRAIAKAKPASSKLREIAQVNRMNIYIGVARASAVRGRAPCRRRAAGTEKNDERCD